MNKINLNKKENLAAIVLVAIFLIIAAVGYSGITGQLPFGKFGDAAAYRVHVARSFMEATYIVDGVTVPLSDDGSGARYFGNETIGDINHDSKNDTVLVLTKKKDGGTAYYLAAALAYQNGFVGSNTLFLGNDITMDTLSIDNGGTISVSYKDPAQGSSLIVRSLSFNAAAMMFGDVVVGDDVLVTGGDSSASENYPPQGLE